MPTNTVRWCTGTHTTRTFTTGTRTESANVPHRPGRGVVPDVTVVTV
jgi:hypothetical protein